jgi:DNA-3-methyladenine glycosylase
MFGEPGRLFVYNVHRYWMLNFVAHEPGEVGGVLVRALEPTIGVETMMENRPVERLEDLTSGPGRLTVALSVDKSLDGSPADDESCPVYVLDNRLSFEVGRSGRIGVSRDLPDELRFYVKGSGFVSRR